MCGPNEKYSLTLRICQAYLAQIQAKSAQEWVKSDETVSWGLKGLHSTLYTISMVVQHA